MRQRSFEICWTAKCLVVLAVLQITGVAVDANNSRTTEQLWKTDFDSGTASCRNKNFVSGIESLKRALKNAEHFSGKDPRLLKTIECLAYAYFLKGELQSAEDLYRRQLRLSDKKFGSESRESVQAMYHLAQTEALAGKFLQAESDGNRAVSISKVIIGSNSKSAAKASFDADFYANNLGCYFCQRNKVAIAVRFYDQAIAFNPKFAQAFFNRGVARQKLGDMRAAQEDYARAKALGLKKQTEQ